MYTNIDYLSNNIAYIREFYNFNKIKPNIIILNKINAKNYKYLIINTEMLIPGCNMFRKNLSQKGFGGLALYIENKYDCIEIELAKFDIFIILRLTEICTKLYICVIYRSPQSSSNNDITLINLMDNICEKYDDSIIFIGDLNQTKNKMK